jgi:membrane protein
MKLVVGGYDVPILLKKTFSELLADNILGLSAASAYAFFFGIFPTFLLAAPILSTFGNKRELFNALFDRMAQWLPGDALSLLRGVLSDVIFGPNAPGLMSLGALLALYSGANMFSTLMTGLNAAYEVHDRRPWWKQQLIAIATMLGALIVMGAALTLFMGGEQLLDAVAKLLHLGPLATIFTGVVQYAAAIALLVFAIWSMYMILPDVPDQSKKLTLVGASAAAILWLLFTSLFRLYVTNYGSYNKTYGTVGAVIVLLTWMYWSVFAVLAGGELNSELRRGTGTAALKQQGSDAGVSVRGRIPTRQGFPHPSSQLG